MSDGFNDALVNGSVGTLCADGSETKVCNLAQRVYALIESLSANPGTLDKKLPELYDAYKDLRQFIEQNPTLQDHPLPVYDFLNEYAKEKLGFRLEKD